jgi:hypothetical protein
MLIKPALFRHYFASKKAQQANARLIKAEKLITKSGRPFATYKCIKEVAHLTKIVGDDEPLLFHSLADLTQPREEDESFSIASWQCVLTGFGDTVRVCKINQKELFKKVQVSDRYSVVDLFKVGSQEDVKALEPLQKNVAQEFDMTEMRNSVAIPPYMFKELTKAGSWDLDTLALEAIKAMKDMMMEASELEDILTEQMALDVPIVSNDASPEELNQKKVDNESKQALLNKKWQRLAEKCGLGAVLFFLNYEDANAVTFENITHIPSIAEATFDIITSKLSSIFTVEGYKFTLLKEERNQYRRASPVQQGDDESFDDIFAHGSEDPLPRSKRPATMDSSAPQAKRPTPSSGLASQVKDFFTALTESDWSSKKKVNQLTVNALLFGASINGLTAASEVPTTGMDILQASSDHEASILITRAFAKLQHPMGHLTSAQTKAFRMFDITWDKNEPPKGMSNLCNKMYSNETKNLDQTHLAIIQAKQDSNTPLTDADVIKLTKHTYHLPTTLVPLMRSLKTQLCLLKMFFGPDAFVCVSYQELMNKLVLCEQDMESMIAEDSMFPTHLLLRVDTVIRKFLKSVVLADHINMVSFKSLSGLGRIGEEIEDDRFLKPTVQPWISEISNSNSSEPDPKPSPSGPKKGKGKGKEGKQGKMIRNEAVSSRLQISRSDYDDNLANLKHKGNRPSKCVKWHCRGVCFDQCKGVIKGRDGHDALSKAEEDEMFKFLQINGLRK